MDLTQALVVVGFPSIGLVGSIAAAYLVRSLRLLEIGYVLSPSLPPMAVIQDGIGTSPIRVFLGDVVCGPDGKCDKLCVVQSDIAPKSSVIAALATALVAWAEEHHARQFVYLEGIKMEDTPVQEARVLGVASDRVGHKMLEFMKIPPQSDGLLVGIGGVALYAARALGQPALCILVETREDFPDARGAAKLLEVLQPLVPHIDIDERPLHEQAQALESVFRERLQRSDRAMKDLSRSADIMFG